MRSIQKQRIQRSLQKSQEGRKKLEEKLEAISSRDRQLYMATINTENKSNERQQYESTPSTGSLLATKGGFHNLRNKDQIKDQLLASVNKIKSFRETGEFDLANLSSINASEAPGGETPQQMDSEFAEQTIDASRNAQLIQEQRYQTENLMTLNNFHSTKSTKQSIGAQLHSINQELQPHKVCNSVEEAQPFLKTCLQSINGNPYHQSTDQFASILSGADCLELDKNLICPKCSHIVVYPVECQSCQYIICFKCAQATDMQCDGEQCREKFTQTPGKIHRLYKERLSQLEFRCPNQA